jgi:hypothetical protein
MRFGPPWWMRHLTSPLPKLSQGQSFLWHPTFPPIPGMIICWFLFDLHTSVYSLFFIVSNVLLCASAQLFGTLTMTQLLEVAVASKHTPWPCHWLPYSCYTCRRGVVCTLFDHWTAHSTFYGVLSCSISASMVKMELLQPLTSSITLKLIKSILYITIKGFRVLGPLHCLYIAFWSMSFFPFCVLFCSPISCWVVPTTALLPLACVLPRLRANSCGIHFLHRIYQLF